MNEYVGITKAMAIRMAGGETLYHNTIEVVEGGVSKPLTATVMYQPTIRETPAEFIIRIRVESKGYKKERTLDCVSACQWRLTLQPIPKILHVVKRQKKIFKVIKRTIRR